MLANEAAKQMEEEDIDVEVIDLRSIRPIDWPPIVESVKRTSRCLVVEEGWATYGVTAEIAAGVQERCFDYLDAPILRLVQVPRATATTHIASSARRRTGSARPTSSASSR